MQLRVLTGRRQIIDPDIREPGTPCSSAADIPTRIERTFSARSASISRAISGIVGFFAIAHPEFPQVMWHTIAVRLHSAPVSGQDVSAQSVSAPQAIS
ncbi:MAG: hypothetical protein AAF558_05475 [Verrucomicrobiota bacterium]